MILKKESYLTINNTQFNAVWICMVIAKTITYFAILVKQTNIHVESYPI